MIIDLSFCRLTIDGASPEYSVKSQDGVELLDLRFSSCKQAVISWDIELEGIAGCWKSGDLFHKNMPADYQPFKSHVAAGVPTALFFNQADENLFAFSISEGLRQLDIAAGINESDKKIHARISLPDVSSAYHVQIRFDLRRLHFSEVLTDAFKWTGAMAEPAVKAAPDHAFEPLYSTWYSYHQNINAEAVERECRAAVEYGIRTLIVDDGWHMSGVDDSYSHCGDWQLDPQKFPSFSEHVKRIHELGIRYMLWIGLPFLGRNTAAYEHFKGFCLYEKPEWKLSVLDPRYPEVRDYLAGRLEILARDSGIDGFKLDFIELFHAKNGNADGLPEAVELLLKEITVRLRKIQPDMLIEFRRPYEGSVLRKYGNMFRAGDCPADFNSNRIQTADLRLICPEAAIHSDMLMWGFHESPEQAALQLIHVLFSVPQISVRLAELPEAHKKMLKFWLGFHREHRQTLLHGKLTPHDCGLLYPYLLAESPSEAIHLLVSGKRILDMSDRKAHFIINASGNGDFILRSFKGRKRISMRNASGELQSEELSSESVITLKAGLSTLTEIIPLNRE